MRPKPIVDGLVMLPGLAHAYLLDGPGGWVLVDTGMPRNTADILDGIRRVCRRPEDVRHILLTHAHPDHIGGAAALKRATGAEIHAHPADAPIVESGGPFRPLRAAPGLRNWVFKTVVLGWTKRVEPTVVDHRLVTAGSLPFDPDLEAIHVPGHCAGQVAFLWRRAGGVLFTADACVNLRGIELPPAVEDLRLAHRSARKLAGLTFDIACFSHGQPILTAADAAFKERWAG